MPINRQPQESEQKEPAAGQIQPPAITLPKGGGAIRGIGEKFAANPVTGTGSMSVPIATSPGRSGFGPQLSLSYDSGSGNGPFGFGWSLSLPSITRKTDKGLPRYWDAVESDEFILSGAEDLVPVLEKKGDDWQREELEPRTVGGIEYQIQRYRPRIEGLFARIERWTNQSDPTDVSWRSISRDNITTWYGKTENSRIADPDDKTRIFNWLICQSYDDKGNAIVYEYESENTNGVDTTQAHENNRTNKTRSANRYVKRIVYGNLKPNRDLDTWKATDPSTMKNADGLFHDHWMFEVVFDYDDGHYEELPFDDEIPEAEQHRYVQTNIAGDHNGDGRIWPVRQDPFSSYKAGFEVRTYRLCHRVLMFHHFPDELGIADYLVRSTEFTYGQSSIASFIKSVTQSGYRYIEDENKYLKKSLPPLEFDYSKADIQEDVQEIDAESLENLPRGLDGNRYQWVDLDGEGLSGILTEQADTWFYKPNRGNGQFGPLKTVAAKPSLAALSSGRQQLLDLAGDGQLDLVQFSGPTPGFYERTHDQYWEHFIPFSQLPNIPWDDPNLRFVDLNGDGHADILITENEIFSWYPSLAEEGFGQAERLRQALEEEKGPRLVFADGTQSIYLADLSGDGLTDLARIRNGEVCYWPSLGYGRFGAKVTMDNAPWFDSTDQFNQQRIRTADIDGSGTTDIIYLDSGGVTIYRNQCGNSWADPESLRSFPPIDNISSVMALDLLGNGTACLVWSSPLPGANGKPLRYIDLMGGQKPHLLEKTANNLGAETEIHYAPSTKFYLDDKEAGKPWITRLPFPVHVVERVVTYDHISRNRFVTHYAYHHGYFDGEEREFRGFGMVEQWDTEEYATLEADGMLDDAENLDRTSHVPPVLTKTWFHTGAYIGRRHISNFFAGQLNESDRGEYFREPAWLDDDVEASKYLLDDTVLPPDLTIEEEREACRALKGMMLRQEIYAEDAPPGSSEEIIQQAKTPYTATEKNFAIRCLQPKEKNKHGVFFAHPLEVINYHYERNPVDPRTSHQLTLEVDDYGNVRKSVSIGYGRRDMIKTVEADGQVTDIPNTELHEFDPRDQDKQTQTLTTYTENNVTKPIDDLVANSDNYRAPLACETKTYELTDYMPTGPTGRFQVSDFVESDPNDPEELILICDNEINYEDDTTNGKQRRCIEHLRTFYRKDDMTGFLGLGELEPLALPGESYKLAFTPELLAEVFNGRITDNMLLDEGCYVHSDGDDTWWIPSGQVFYHLNANTTNPANTAADELTEAQNHFFLPRKFTDPFKQSSTVDYEHDLLVVTTRDALNNTVHAEYNYRVLQPSRMIDPNNNHTIVAFDALGLVVGTAIQGKINNGQPESDDNLDDFVAYFTQAQRSTFFEAADPHVPAPGFLKEATTRIIYDLDCFNRTYKANPLAPDTWQPSYAATLARETHVNEPPVSGDLKIQVSFSYSDGFGREIQKKIQAEHEHPGGPVRWVGSGWTVFNNKGKPVKQFEPFFSDTHQFNSDTKIGVSPDLFYDPVGRVIATIYPNHTYEKVVFNPWHQTTYDVNDTVNLDPRTDADISGYVEKYFEEIAPNPSDWETWYTQRIGGTLGTKEQEAAIKAEAHAETPTTAYFDTLGRPFLTTVHNKVVCPGHAQDGTKDKFSTRVKLDIEGNQREIIDSKDRIVMRYDYSIAGPEQDENGEPINTNLIHQFSMEAGERWILNDVAGNPLYTWDSRDHRFHNLYDELRRPTEVRLCEGTSPEKLVNHIIYGESQSNPETDNLRGQVFQIKDQASVVTNRPYDFKGNLLVSTRELLPIYNQTVNWLQNPVADSGSFTSRTTYDALNRPITITSPDNSVYRPTFNEANLLDKVAVNLRAEQENGQPKWTSFVTNIDYNAKGQRELIEYANGVKTWYEYDLFTFRLTHLFTARGAAFPQECEAELTNVERQQRDCPKPQPQCKGVQNLHYTYDPVGNITHIRDDAQQTVYFRNKCVEPSADYTYDALYRLIKATGREHLGQTGGTINRPTPPDAFNNFHTNKDHPHNGNTMGTYIEEYIYDAVGNILSMKHRGSNPAHPGWTCTYNYQETSLLENGKFNNRLTSTVLGTNNPVTYSYLHNEHGSMKRMPHLANHPNPDAPNMHWDFKDQLIRVDLGGGGTAYYVYDASGQRVRKVWEKSPGLIEERIYLGGFEIFRKHNGPGSITLERETLHIMDNQQRIALIETRTIGDDGSPEELIRYQFGNHLGSASLELDDQTKIISYEEYYPYGSTSYQAVRKDIQVPLKRYSYSGKERDEETGLYYYGARYYASWLGRWTAADPAGFVDGVNVYVAVRSNPVNGLDLNGMQTNKKEPKSKIEKFAQTVLDVQLGVGDAVGDIFLGLVITEVRSVVDPVGIAKDILEEPAKKFKENVTMKSQGKDIGEIGLIVQAEAGKAVLDIINTSNPAARFVDHTAEAYGTVKYGGGDVRETTKHVTHAYIAAVETVLIATAAAKSIYSKTSAGKMDAAIAEVEAEIAYASEIEAAFEGIISNDPIVKPSNQSLQGAARSLADAELYESPNIAEQLVKRANVVAVYEPPGSNLVFGARSSNSTIPYTRQVGRVLHSIRQNLRSNFHGKCADVKALLVAEKANALIEGGNMANAEVWGLKDISRHGRPKLPCASCGLTLKAMIIGFIWK